MLEEKVGTGGANSIAVLDGKLELVGPLLAGGGRLTKLSDKIIPPANAGG